MVRPPAAPNGEIRGALARKPSAGRPLGGALRRRPRDRGIGIAALPLPERYAVPAATWAAALEARRVIAVGTSVVRALETAARGPLAGVTDLRMGPGTALQLVDGLLSSMHEPGESHFQLMAALTDLQRLRGAIAHAASAGYRDHEFGTRRWCSACPQRPTAAGS